MPTVVQEPCAPRSLPCIVLLALFALLAGCAGSPKAAVLGSELAPAYAVAGTDLSPDFPTLEDFWNGDAEFLIDEADTGLPMGESDTVILPDGRYRAYVHASDWSLGVVDSCGEAVPFPGCVVLFESADGGRTFRAVSDAPGRVTCLIPCASCPCDSRRDHVDQQQYPRVARVASGRPGAPDQWLMVYEYRGSVFWRMSADGLAWSASSQLPGTGVWKTWLMPCRAEESIGPHPYAPAEYDCLVGGPPGLFVTDEDDRREAYVFVGLGQNPGSMGCYRARLGGDAAFFRKCDSNPLFTGAASYGAGQGPQPGGNAFFDFRTISSADVVEVRNRYYMLYEGVRGPEQGAAGDTQFALGLARSVTDRLDGPWETYAGNPILLDVPGNVGVGHADVVVDGGETILFTSLDGVTRSRLALRWK